MGTSETPKRSETPDSGGPAADAVSTLYADARGIKPLGKRERQFSTLGLAIVATGLFWYSLGYDFRHHIGSEPEQGKEVVKPSARDTTLTANIGIAGDRFVVANHDAFDWTNCRLEVNGALLRSGYQLHVELIRSHSTYQAEARRFAKPDGERLDVTRSRPNNMTVSCDVNGRRGYFAGGWQ